MTEVRILDADEAERERGRLAEILADCVNGGSSVSFMWPFTVEDAATWWGGAIKTVESGKTVLFGGYVAGSLVGTVQLSLDVPPNQLHRGDVRKLLVHRKARRQGVAAALMAALEKNRAISQALAPDPGYRHGNAGRAVLRSSTVSSKPKSSRAMR